MVREKERGRGGEREKERGGRGWDKKHVSAPRKMAVL